jgi:hypothetical protein
LEIFTASQKKFISKNYWFTSALVEMNISQITFLLALLLFSAACSSDAISQNLPAQSPTAINSPTHEQGNADVLFVVAEQQEDLTWTFTVTISHPDTGWEDYADGWDVILPDGTVLKKAPSDQFTRLLTHPHVDEQPFTRSQSGIKIPGNAQVVIVRAHDLVDGYGGETVIVNLELPFGKNYEVIRNNFSEESILGLTNHNLDGNRYVTGQIDLENAHEIIIPLNGTPIWVVGIPQPNKASLWLVALEDGTLQTFLADQKGYSEIQPPAETLPPNTPPALLKTDSENILLNAQYENASPDTFPIPISDDKIVYISDQGGLNIQSPEQSISLPINALPDGRVLSDSQGSLLVLSEPTSQYQHAVLGDNLEAKSISLINSQGETATINKITIPEGKVIEGIAPIWTDLNSDGQREILVTLSDDRYGAQLAVFSEAGEIISLSEPIGSGYRWRHQVAAAPFGPEGEIEIVDVLTPHIGGVVEFFKMEGNELLMTAHFPGFTSHVIGSRNLDMALAADVDADGHVELLLPSQQLSTLGAIQRTAVGAEIDFEIPLTGLLSTNIASVKFNDRTLAIAIGLDTSVLKIWIP